MTIPHANNYRTQRHDGNQYRSSNHRHNGNNQNRVYENTDIKWKELIGGAVVGASTLKAFQIHPFVTVVSLVATGYMFFKDQ